jgi:hypothetical protein
MKPKLAIYGAGENGGYIVSEFRSGRMFAEYDLAGFVDDGKTGKVFGLPILGGRSVLTKFRRSYGIDNMLVTLLDDAAARLEICEEIDRMGFSFPSYNPHPVPNKGGGRGIYVDAASKLLCYETDIGDFSVVGPHTTIEGGVEIGRGVIISPHVFLGSGTRVGDGTKISPFSMSVPQNGSRDGIRIGSGCVVGPYALISRDLPDGMRMLPNLRKLARHITSV